MRHLGRRDFLTASSVLLGGLVLGKRSHAETLNWQFSRCDSKYIQGAYPLPERIANMVKVIFGREDIAASQQLSIISPCIVESAAVVPIRIISDLEDIQRIAVFAEHNSNPLITIIQFSSRSQLPISLRLQLEYKVARIYVVCETKSQLYASSNLTKVNMQCSGDGG
jgi:predicted secreted protein